MLSQVLPLIVYLFLIIFLLIGIIIGIKLIISMNKIERIIDNVEGKINSLNGFFSIIEMTSGKITNVYEKVIDFVGGIVDRLFLSRKSGKDYEDYE